MKFRIDKLEVSYPGSYVTSEQLDFMKQIVASLTHSAPDKASILELPEFLGKRKCLLSVCVAILIASEFKK